MSFRRVAVAVSACLVLFGGVPSGAPSFARSASVERGQLVASGGGAGGINAACISCHGVSGSGDAGAAFPRLSGLDARYIAKQLADYASGARPNAVMTPIALSLSERDRRSLGLFYAGLRSSVVPAIEARLAESSEGWQVAAALYAQGSQRLGIQACANCHGRDGRGLGSTYPAVAGQPAAYTAEQLRVFRQELRTNDPGGSMRTVAKALSDDHIDGLARYLEALQP